MPRFSIVLWATVVAALAGCHAPPTPPVDPVTSFPKTTRPAASARSADVIRVHDLVRWTVAFEGDDVDPTVTTDRVDDAGRIPLTMLSPVLVAGLTEPAAADAIVAAYRNARITAHAKVTLVEHANPGH